MLLVTKKRPQKPVDAKINQTEISDEQGSEWEVSKDSGSLEDSGDEWNR